MISLIIECCKTDQNTTNIKKSISDIHDWKEFINLAFSHGVFPLVYHTLKTYDKLIPNDILKSMKTHNRNIAQQNMLMSVELIKVMKLLKENNIEAIAFKGPTLAQMAYGDISLRQFSDLDILIAQEDILKAYNLLSTFSTTETKYEYLQNDLYMDKLNDITFIHNTNNILIELHWNLFQKQFSDTFSFSDILKTKQDLQIQHHTFSIFSNEILLVYLCMHGSKHSWERISWILDIDRILRIHQDLDWDFIEQQAKKLECETMLDLGLSLTKKLFDTPIMYKYNSNPKLIEYVETSFTDLPLTKTEFTINYNGFKFRYMLHDNFLSKTRYLLKTLFPINAQDVSFVQLPQKLYFLYYAIKPLRLSLKYTQKLFNHS